ncbi:hypothetical protein BG28_09170 [Nesterenkonia sp. AN1]|nr:hypothetical protein BG28_09170 [Nesterenkonia sp. AN1]
MLLMVVTCSSRAGGLSGQECADVFGAHPRVGEVVESRGSVATGDDDAHDCSARSGCRGGAGLRVNRAGR